MRLRLDRTVQAPAIGLLVLLLGGALIVAIFMLSASRREPHPITSVVSDESSSAPAASGDPSGGTSSKTVRAARLPESAPEGGNTDRHDSTANSPSLSDSEHTSGNGDGIKNVSEETSDELDKLMEEWMRLADPSRGGESTAELRESMAQFLQRASSFEEGILHVLTMLEYMHAQNLGWGEVAVGIWRGIRQRPDTAEYRNHLLDLLEKSENPAIVNALAPAVGTAFYRTDHARALRVLFDKAVHFSQEREEKYAGLVVGNCQIGYANVSKDLLQPVLLLETLLARADRTMVKALDSRLFRFCVDSLGRVLQGHRLDRIAETGWVEVHRRALALVVDRVNGAGGFTSQDATIRREEVVKALAALQHDETRMALIRNAEGAPTEDLRAFYEEALLAWQVEADKNANK
jgi:hypothetical protein